MKKYFNSILVPTDFSEQSNTVLKQTFNLARLNNVAITLLHVIPENTGSFFIPFFSKVQTKLMTEQYLEECQAKLNKVIEGASGNTEVSIYPLVETGKVYEKIIDVAQKISPKYVVMGVNALPLASHKKRTIGSNTLKVLREITFPVITIQGDNFRDGCKTILLPLDLSKETSIKVATAIRIAKFYDATIKIFFCVLSKDEKVIRQLNTQLKKVQKLINENSVVCYTESRTGVKGKDTLARMILDYADEIEADLIMIMTQQEKDWVEFFVGSTAQEIIAHSQIPVMSLSPR